MERYSLDLDELVGKPSLINEAQAHGLATQWLAAVDVDAAALDKQKWVVHQLRYLAHGATNAVTHCRFITWISAQNTTPTGRKTGRDWMSRSLALRFSPLQKELQEMRITDLSYSRRPPLLITNRAGSRANARSACETLGILTIRGVEAA